MTTDAKQPSGTETGEAITLSDELRERVEELLVDLRAASLRVNNEWRTAKLGYQTVEGKTCVDFEIRETTYSDASGVSLAPHQVVLVDPDATLTTQLWDVMTAVVRENQPDSGDAGAWGEVTIDVLQGWVFLHHRARRITYEWSEKLIFVDQPAPAAAPPSDAEADDPRP